MATNSTSKTKAVRTLQALILATACLAPSSAPAFMAGLPDWPIERAEGAGLEPGEYFSFALKMKERGNLIEAARSFGEIRRLFPATGWALRAGLQLALMDQGPGAIELIEEASALPDIDDYILFYQAEALARAGRHLEAAGSYAFVLSEYPDSALRERASFGRALSLLGSGDPVSAAEALRAFLSAFPRSQRAPEAMLTLAKLELDAGLRAAGAGHLREVYSAHPVSTQAAEAKRLLSGLLASGSSEAALTPPERFRRAERLFKAARYASALEEYSALLNDREYGERALYRQALSNVRLKKYGDASRALSNYLSVKGRKEEAGALYLKALVAFRQNEMDRLMDAEKALQKGYPKSEERSKVLMLIARALEGKDPEGAANAYRTVVEEFGGLATAAEAFWNMAWGAYTAGRLEDAYDAFSVYAEANPGGADLEKFLYWKARTSERLGRTIEALEGYSALASSGRASYYSLLAQERARALAPAQAGAAMAAGALSAEEATLDGSAAAAREPFRDDRHYRTAMALLEAGLRKDAADEIDLLARSHRGEKDALAGLAELLYEAEDFYRGYRIVRVHLSGMDGARVRSLGFPPALVQAVREKTHPGSADPFLAAAVMREESHFDPGAVSPVGALGIMQIMPSTGAEIARELGVGLKPGGLLDPDTNMRFGAWYLGRLAERFDGNLILAVAAYNAGPNAAARWARSLPAEADEFIESIPYAETRSYTKRVFRSYFEFLRSAGEAWEERLERTVAPKGSQKEAKAADGISS